MEETFIELIDAPDLKLNITEYNPEFTILNDRSDKSSSGVWNHFGAIKYHDAVDKKHVYCTHCFFNRRIKKYQKSTSTGNLSKHLRKQHSISLNQSFRVKKNADNSIHLVKKEEPDVDKEPENFETTNDEYLVHDINEILISEVAKRPLLYSNTHTHPGEKGLKLVMRRQLWIEVYEALNHLIPLARLPKIWKNIRDRYQKVRRQAHFGKPKYRYYDMLSFLDNIIDDQKSIQYEQTEEETEVDEFLISGDHDHYITSETIVLPNDAVAYEEISEEPKAKKQKSAKKQTTYQISEISASVDAGTKQMVTVPIASSSIIEESFANATTNDLFEEFEPQKKGSFLNHSNIEVIASTPVTAQTVNRKQDEFDIFGNFVAEVMRNMNKPKSRILQMDIMKLIADAESS